MITKNSFNQLLLNDWFVAAVAVVIVAILFYLPDSLFMEHRYQSGR
jgi:hypothetical protein